MATRTRSFAPMTSPGRPRKAALPNAVSPAAPVMRKSRRLRSFSFGINLLRKVMQCLVNELRCPRKRVSAVGVELHREISTIGALPGYFEHPLQVHAIGFAIELHRAFYVAHVKG